MSVNDVLSTTCTVTYQPPLSDGGSPVIGYHVERQTPGSRWIRVNKEAVPGLSCPVTDLLEGNEYEFRVAAENKAGVGEFSAVTPKITAKNPWEKPGKPGRPAAVEVVGASVKLEWKAPDRYCTCYHSNSIRNKLTIGVLIAFLQLLRGMIYWALLSAENYTNDVK